MLAASNLPVGIIIDGPFGPQTPLHRSVPDYDSNTMSSPLIEVVESLL